MVSYAIVVKYSILSRPLNNINLTHHSELWEVIVLSSPLMSLGQHNSQYLNVEIVQNRPITPSGFVHCSSGKDSWDVT